MFSANQPTDLVDNLRHSRYICGEAKECAQFSEGKEFVWLGESLCVCGEVK